MKKLRLRNNQKGFTLVEIAIVMVIIGLLIGGILKGQEMINNAKVKRVVKQADEMRAAVMTFYDKYGQYPGDENSTLFPPGVDTAPGDNNGQIYAAEAPGVFTDLVLANLVSGAYTAAAPYPSNAFGGTTRVQWVDPGPGTARHYIWYTNLPAEACLEIDVKYDDGVVNTGSIAGSAVYTAGNTIANFYIAF
ncbi:MAG: prepilin-type N-terminal cleavage/methylation domain-containing protein [Proteobacteria bacterium]|nr:prepilin-type N-terminal cleavage/methylation domain-containing protein [Pseudomonadota bacterium]MBU2457669.1 prepilin-type N-terminal cleavage/methylation domain-containing protein [Planctomycetota bacterium]